MQSDPPVVAAGPLDLDAAAALLHDFNTEFGEPAPPVPELAGRLAELLEGADTVILLAGDPPVGVAVMRLRHALWSVGLEAYLAELYVAPGHRRRGAGRALVQAAVNLARKRGARYMSIEVDEPDSAARRLYESFGFSNRHGVDGPLMFVYQREL